MSRLALVQRDLVLAVISAAELSVRPEVDQLDLEF
jgi:hypothetical protein